MTIFNSLSGPFWISFISDQLLFFVDLFDFERTVIGHKDAHGEMKFAGFTIAGDAAGIDISLGELRLEIARGRGFIMEGRNTFFERDQEFGGFADETAIGPWFALPGRVSGL